MLKKILAAAVIFISAAAPSFAIYDPNHRESADGDTVTWSLFNNGTKALPAYDTEMTLDGINTTEALIDSGAAVMCLAPSSIA